eukprot:6205602-Pleurochrysis_carterae.AAC.1
MGVVGQLTGRGSVRSELLSEMEREECDCSAETRGALRGPDEGASLGGAGAASREGKERVAERAQRGRGGVRSTEHGVGSSCAA